MRALVMWFVAVTLIVSPAMAGSGKDKDATATAKADAKPAATTKSADATKQPDAAKQPASGKPDSPAVEAELQQLKELLQAQTHELEAQRAALKEQQQKMDALEERLRGAQPATAVVGAPAAATLTAGAPAPSAASGAPQERREEAPTAIHIKGITLTPGGFMAAEGVWRQRALSADVNTPFNSLPLPGSSQDHVTEFNASGRQSRISMLAEGKLSTVKIGGYYEADFLSAGTTSNNNESNSYTFRQRQFWAQAAFDSGWTFTGGQMWSLVTETRKGVNNRTEAVPLTIDAQYVPGFSWARQYGFRVSKSFSDKFWLAASVEGPQTTFTASGNSSNFLIGAPGTSGGLFSPTANYSFNASPDFVFKAAFEPGWGHYEVFGVVSVFRARIFPCQGASVASPCPIDGSTAPSAVGANNDTRTGGGFGANLRVPLFAKKLDVGLHALAGDGIGRYGTTGLPDVTVRPDGTLALIRGGQGLGTLEWHATSKDDIYGYGGGEYAARTAYLNSKGSGVGYGSPLFVNTGCFTETLPGNQFTPGSLAGCRGDTREIIDGTFGFWHRFYKGDKGTVQWGAQYDYFIRKTWSGVGGRPSAVENMVFTSFRYYLP